MPFSRKLFIVVLAATATLLFSGCGLSLAGDVTPPPNYRQPTRVPVDEPASSTSAFPLVPPDPVRGEQIFVEKCAPCHGDTGKGDGPRAGDLPNPTAPIGDRKFARNARPVDWYQMVTNGDLGRYMPGFSSLSDRERWDVVAYAFRLSVTQEELEQGKALYETFCAGCHGLDGRGGGPQAEGLAAQPANWSDQQRLVQLSEAEMAEIIANGDGEMPAFAGELDENQRYAVVSYIRSLSYASGDLESASVTGDATPTGAAPTAEEAQPAAATPAATGEGAARSSEDIVDESIDAPARITIQGTITNATPGGKIPADLEVTLLGYKGMAPAFDLTTRVEPDGSYTFEDVDYDPEFVYFAQVKVDGISFNSDILHGQDVIGTSTQLPLRIYDTTTDISALRTDRLHVFFDFSKTGTIQVVELFIISNPGDQVVVAGAEDQPVITFPLPEGASNLQFQNGELGGRFVETENGFGDRSSVPPGMGLHQVLFAYELPYNKKLDLTLQTPLPVEAAVMMLPPVGVELKGSQLLDAGQRDVQGMSFQMYQVTSRLNGGDSIKVSLSGQPGQAAAGGFGDSDSLTALLVGLGVFGAVLIGAGYWLYRRQSQQGLMVSPAAVGEGAEGDLPGGEAFDESSESLIEAIVALDDLHASGGLPEAAYHERRRALKARLAEALEREKGS